MRASLIRMAQTWEFVYVRIFWGAFVLEEEAITYNGPCVWGVAAFPTFNEPHGFAALGSGKVGAGCLTV